MNPGLNVQRNGLSECYEFGEKCYWRIKEMETNKHLWEIDHAYYCNLGNYFSNDCGQHYESFDAFLEDWGSADPDYNLLFRWDWRFDEETGHHLEIFWIGQRKGLFMYSYVDVTPDDEQRVIEFLKPKKQHLIGLWEGV